MKTHIKYVVRGTGGSLKLRGGDVKGKLRKPLKCPFVHTRSHTQPGQQVYKHSQKKQRFTLQLALLIFSYQEQ